MRGRDGRWRLPPDDALMLVPTGSLDFAGASLISRALAKGKAAVQPALRVWQKAGERSLRDAASRMDAAQ